MHQEKYMYLIKVRFNCGHKLVKVSRQFAGRGSITTLLNCEKGMARCLVMATGCTRTINWIDFSVRGCLTRY